MEKCDLICDKCESYVFPVIMFLIIAYLTAIAYCVIYVIIKILGSSTSEVTNIITIIGTVIAIFTLWKGIHEYQEHMKRQRIQYLLDMGRKYSEDKSITKVVNCLEKLSTEEEKSKTTTIKNTDLDIHDIEIFMRFIEELQMLIDAKVVNKPATLYLFGFYVKTFDKHHIRFEKLDDYNETYWGAFIKFAKSANEFNYEYKNVLL